MTETQGLKSRPGEAIKRVFDTPNWVSNLVWLTVASLTANFFIGQIALLGYGSELIKNRIGLPGAPRHDVDSERLGDYISQGIWPFVVQFVIQLVGSIFVSIPMVLILFGGLGIGAAAFGEEGAALGLFGSVPLVILLSFAVLIATVPVLIRAMILQDFASSFDFGWSWRFFKLMWAEIAFSGLIYYIFCIGLGILGFLCCFVGVFVASGVAMGGAMHMLAQWYEIYLDRGGEPVYGKDEIIDANLV